MAAKNTKTRNLTTSITKILDDATYNQNKILRGYEGDLTGKQVSTDYVRKHSRHDEFVETVQRQVDRATNNVNTHQKRYNELLEDRLTMKSNDATEALLAETRATKAWNRFERELKGMSQSEQFTAVSHRIETAVKKGDHVTLAAINSEAPHYLRTIGVKDPEQIVELIVRTHDAELNEAHRDITEAEKLKALTVHNTTQVVRAFEENFTTGLKGNLNELDKVGYYIEPGDAIRSSVDEANAALKTALNEAQSRDKHSTDTSDIDDASYNPDAPTSDNVAEDTVTETENKFSSTEGSYAPDFYRS